MNFPMANKKPTPCQRWLNSKRTLLGTNITSQFTSRADHLGRKLRVSEKMFNLVLPPQAWNKIQLETCSLGPLVLPRADFRLPPKRLRSDGASTSYDDSVGKARIGYIGLCLLQSPETMQRKIEYHVSPQFPFCRHTLSTFENPFQKSMLNSIHSKRVMRKVRNFLLPGQVGQRA